MRSEDGVPDLGQLRDTADLQRVLQLMTATSEQADEDEIIKLASAAVRMLCPCHVGGVYLSDVGWVATSGSCERDEVREDVEAQLLIVARSGGWVAIADETWGWAFPLSGLEGHFGHLLVCADQEPSMAEHFLLNVLALQTGTALGSARLHAQESASAAGLRRANVSLAMTVAALERTTDIHERLTRVAVAGEGQEGIALALHELTGLPVAIEDRHGNTRACAGLGNHDAHPEPWAWRREGVIRRAQADGRPVRDGDRLVAVACPRGDLLGVLMLFDPEGRATDHDQVALEHGSIVLAMELARLEIGDETERRVGRELVDELITGGDEERALEYGQSLGYNLGRHHRVVVIEPEARSDEPFFHAVRRAARDMGVGSLVTIRGGAIVVLAVADVAWVDFHRAITIELGGGHCHLGVGGICARLGDYPRSYHEARLVLKMQRARGVTNRAMMFDELGVYGILAEVDDVTRVEEFARTWLGALLEYDVQKRADLTGTLESYLECGKNLAAAARMLAIHPSTLKYRLRRITQISGHDLADADTAFNLQLAARAWRTLLTLRAP